MESSDRYSLPVGQFVAGVSSSFPRPGRQHTLESAIEKRIELTVKPANATSDGGFTGDGFVEFRVMGCPGQLLDLSELVLDIEGYVVMGDGTVAADDSDVQLTNLAMCTLIRSVAVYLNNVQVDTVTSYGYSSYIRTLLNTPAWREHNTLKMMGYTGLGMYSKLTQTAIDASKGRNVTSFAFLAPLCVDIASCDGYLLDNVDVRIRLELASDKFVLNTCTPTSAPRYKLTKTDLRVTKLKPMDNAIQALSNQLEKVPQVYVFDKTMYCSRPVAVGQTRVTIDNPFGKVIPSKMWFSLVGMARTLGVYNMNSVYFHHEGIRKLDVLLDNELVYSLYYDWVKKRYLEAYGQFVRCAGTGHAPLVTYDNFGEGSTIHLLSLTPEVVGDDVIQIEREGQMRVSIELGSAPSENLLLMLYGQTQGTLSVDRDRNVLVDVRQ